MEELSVYTDSLNYKRTYIQPLFKHDCMSKLSAGGVVGSMLKAHVSGLVGKQ